MAKKKSAHPLGKPNELYGDIEQPMANAIREHLRRQKGGGRIDVRDHQPSDPGHDLIIADVPGSGTTVQM